MLRGQVVPREFRCPRRFWRPRVVAADDGVGLADLIRLETRRTVNLRQNISRVAGRHYGWRTLRRHFDRNEPRHRANRATCKASSSQHDNLAQSECPLSAKSGHHIPFLRNNNWDSLVSRERRHRSRQKPFASSSPTQRPIRAKSIWRPPAKAARSTCSASCSR
jgi:hypothetical protein